MICQKGVTPWSKRKKEELIDDTCTCVDKQQWQCYQHVNQGEIRYWRVVDSSCVVVYYCQISNIRQTKSKKMFLASSCSCLCPIHWSQVLSREEDTVGAAPTGDAPSAWNGRPWPGRSQNWMLMYFIINLSGSQQFSGSSIQNQVELSKWATGRFMHCAPTTFEWSTNLLPAKMQLMLQIWG